MDFGDLILFSVKLFEKNKDIVTLGKVIAEFSETIRKKYMISQRSKIKINSFRKKI